MDTLFIGKHLIELDSVDSTNNYSTELIRSGKAFEGTVVWTHEQTKGRGQRGNNWESEPGRNLTASIILFPSFLTAMRQFDLTMCISLAVMQTIKSKVEKPVLIKWPNDIYIEGRKCAGILMESGISGTNLSYTIAGIGINVNQLSFNESKACSIAEFSAKQDIKLLLMDLCGWIEKYYLLLKDNKEQVKAQYLMNLYRISQYASFNFQNRYTRAMITGISSTGKLLLSGENGENLEADFKEIEFLAD